VIGGRIDFLADSPASMQPQVRGGRMRALVVTAPKRLPTFPGIPTVAEIGLPDAEADFTSGLFAPMGTPAPVLARLQAEALKVAQSPEFHSYLASQGYEPLALEGAAFGKLIREGLAKWERVVKERGIKVE
jgi:tripartite-type tricarboxylate transporter receptor subunit TctC